MKQLILLILIGLLAALFCGRSSAVTMVQSEDYPLESLERPLMYCQPALKKQYGFLRRQIVLDLSEPQYSPQPEAQKPPAVLPEEKPIEEIPGEEQPPQEAPSDCVLIWVVDQPAQKEKGHYETVQHPAVTEIQYEYEPYVCYTFYRQDGTCWVYEDRDGSFQPDSYLQEHVEEFVRYRYETCYLEHQKEVVIEPAWKEEVWVIDSPAVPEIGHYEEVCS